MVTCTLHTQNTPCILLYFAHCIFASGGFSFTLHHHYYSIWEWRFGLFGKKMIRVVV